MPHAVHANRRVGVCYMQSMYRTRACFFSSMEIHQTWGNNLKSALNDGEGALVDGEGHIPDRRGSVARHMISRGELETKSTRSHESLCSLVGSFSFHPHFYFPEILIQEVDKPRVLLGQA